MTDGLSSRTYGRGPRKVVVMNGWLGLSRHWLPMLEAMDPDRFECVLFEYRGYGSRRSEVGVFRFEEAASDVTALADKLGWATFSIMGHSMGGMAMQRVALLARHRVTKLLGIAPVSAAGSKMDTGRRAFFESAVDDVSVRQQILHLSTGQRLPHTWSRGMAADSQENSPAAMRAYLHEWTSGGFAGQIGGLDVPVKVLVGEFDPGISAAQANDTWRVHYTHAEIEVIPQVGHYPMQELPLSVAGRAQTWLWQ
jgi:pimeloyl-ACP methyl ester carboxylesterase